MQVDDLFTKIGILTVENDVLRAELNRLKEQLEEAQKREEQPERRLAVRENSTEASASQE